MKTATVNNKMLQRLDVLTEKIRVNKADVFDYDEYQQILITSGAFTDEEILKNMKDFKLNSYQELIDARNKAKTIEDKKEVEGGIIVGLVAHGLALIFGAGRR